MTRSLYQIPYFELTCAPKHSSKKTKVSRLVSRKAKKIVAGQGQPNHALKTKGIGSEKTYGPKIHIWKRSYLVRLALCKSCIVKTKSPLKVDLWRRFQAENGVIFSQIWYDIALFARQVFPQLFFFPNYYLNRLCLTLSQNVTWTDEKLSWLTRVQV